MATATLYPTQAVTNNPINRNVAADPVNTPIIFEPPAALVGASPQVWIAASGGSRRRRRSELGRLLMSGCRLDGTSYSQIGSIVGAGARRAC